MEKKLASSDISEEQREKLKQQMQVVSSGSVVQQFAQYSMQKQQMYSQMTAVAMPTVVAYQMPMMMVGG